MDEQKRGDEVSEGPSLTVRQAAALLGLPEARIRRMLREAVLKGHREGGAWRIDAAAIRAFKQNQIAGVDAPKPAAGDSMKDTETLQPPSEHGKAAGSDQPSGYQPPGRPTIQPELTTWRYRAGRRTRQLLYEHPHATRPVRRVLWRLASYAERADRLAVFQAHDAEENAQYALPDGETPMLAAVWTIELYTPSSIDGLFDGLRRHPWLWNRDSSSTDPVQWVKDQRGRPWPGGWMSLARVVPPGTPGHWALLGGTAGEVPEGFSSIHLAIVIISPTLTGVVGCFMPTDELAVELNKILRREESTTMSSDPSGRWVLHYLGNNKRASVDAMRTGVHRAAIDWVGRHLPGIFARGLLDGEMPTFDLILTEKVEPGPDKPPGRQQERWLDLLGLGTLSTAWTCRDLPGLSAVLPSPLRAGLEHHVTLAAKRTRLFTDAQLDDAGRDPRALVGRLDTYYLAPLATRWAISGLLSGIERRLAHIRDLAERSSRRSSLGMLGELRRELLAVGLDGHIVAADIVAFTSSAARYDHDVLEFIHARTLRHRNAQHSHPPAKIPPALREQQHQRSDRILEVERQLREVLSTTGNLASAISNLRLQLFVAILAVISTAAAIIAVIAAILALNLSQPTPLPPSSPPTSQSTSTSTPTRSSR